MSIQSEINRILHFRDQSFEEVRNKGVTVPQDAIIDDLPDYIAQIQTGSGGAGAISIVDTPDAAGGTVRTITAVDISDTTAAAGDVAQGKYFYTAQGVKTAGTASGGGGLEYEEGTWTPASDVAKGTITFAKTHSSAPMYIRLLDLTGTDPAASSNLWFAFADYRKSGGGVLYNGSAYRYGDAEWAVRTSSGFTTGSASFTEATDIASSSSSPYYWATEAEFHPYVNSSSRYWRSGRTYKWIAVWAPTA